jgi:hypothetical protein
MLPTVQMRKINICIGTLEEAHPYLAVLTESERYNSGLELRRPLSFISGKT